MGTTARKLAKQRKRFRHALRSLDVTVSLTADFNAHSVGTIGRRNALVYTACSFSQARGVLVKRFGDNTGEIVRLFHGTPTCKNLGPISEFGLRISNWGMFGAGVYFGRVDKAMDFADGYRAMLHRQGKTNGALLECAVALGRVQTARKALNRGAPGCDVIHGCSGAGLRRDEWCVSNTDRIVIIAAYVLLEKRRHSYIFGPPITTKSGNSHPDDAQKLLAKQPPPGYSRRRTY